MDNFGISAYNVCSVFLRFIQGKRRVMKNKRSVFQAFAMIMQFSLNMIVPIVMCTLLGVWIDEKFHIPVITVPLFLMGALAGFRNIYIMAKKIYQDDSKTQKKK